MKKTLNLQLFAEAESTETVDTATVAHGSANENEQAEKKTETAEKKTKQAKYTDEDVDEILNRKFAKWEEKRAKAVNEAKRLAEMSAQEKAEYERDKLQKELDEYKKRAVLADMTKTARKMLSDNGITISDNLLALMVTTDADKTKNAIDEFSNAFTKAVEAEVKERLRGGTPKRGSGSTSVMTKQQIMDIKDPELRQKKMLENRELFNF